MNRALIDPFQHSSYPETIEEYLERGLTKCVAFNRRGTILAAGCQNGEVVLWDFDTRGVLRAFSGHKTAVTAVAWTRNGRQLLSASQSGEMLLFDVLSGDLVRKVALGSAATMIQGHPTDASRALASCAGGAPVLLDLKTGSTSKLPLFAANMGDDAPTGTRRGGADALGGQAVFSKGGEHAFVGTSKGWLLAVHLKTLTVTEGVRVAPVNAPAVKTLSLSKSGTVLLANCGDRTIRTFDVPVSPPDAPAAAGAERPPSMRLARDFKNAVSNVQWSAATLSADSDYLVGASGGSGEHLLYVWLRQHGTLEKILEGPQSATVSQVAWHPKRCVLAAVSGDGRVYLWAKVFQENWSAFAPDFKELDENEEYVEREDEFDAEQEGAAAGEKAGAGAGDDGDGDVDIETVDPALADSDEEDVPDALHYLPLAPERDERFARRPTPPPGAAQAAVGTTGEPAAPAAQQPKQEPPEEDADMSMLLNDGPGEDDPAFPDLQAGAAGKRGPDAPAGGEGAFAGTKRPRPEEAGGA